MKWRASAYLVLVHCLANTVLSASIESETQQEEADATILSLGHDSSAATYGSGGVSSLNESRYLQEFGVEAFECDGNDEAISEPVAKNQGDRIRICILPDATARDAGVVMNSVNSLQLLRDSVSQDVLLPDSVIQDFRSTKYGCTPGEPLCFVETPIENAFFTSSGEISVQGTAWLQYGADVGRRRLEQDGSLPTLLRTQVTVRSERLPKKANRRAQTSGEFIGGRDFSFSFAIEPSGTEWEAIAFLCNGRSQPFQGEAATRPRNRDDEIRVCVTPSPEAQNAGVFVRSITSFYFEQDDRRQFAVQATGVQAPDTIFICGQGYSLCAFKTELADEFFIKDVNISAVGEVILQYGTDSDTTTQNSRKTIELSRGLQDGSSVDAAFAGRSDMLFEIEVDPTYVPESEKSWREKAQEWWEDTPLFLRIVYVLSAIIALIIILCFTYAICCGLPCVKSKDKDLNEEETKTRVFVQQPIHVNVDEESEEEKVDSGPRPTRMSKNAAAETDGPVEDKNPLLLQQNITENEAPKYAEDIPEEGFMQLADSSSVKSPKRPSSKRASSKSPKPFSRKSAPVLSLTPSGQELGNGSSHSRRVSSRSPRPSRKSTKPNDGLQASTHSRKSVSSKSPKPGRREVAKEDGLPFGSGHSRKSVASSKSPKPRRKIVGEDGLPLSSAHSRKSVASKSPKPRRRGVEADESASPRSPKKRSSKVKSNDGLGGSAHSRKSVGSTRRSTRTSKSPRRDRPSTNGTSTPRGSIRTPGGRRASVEDGISPRSRRSPRSRAQNDGGMPEDVPF